MKHRLLTIISVLVWWSCTSILDLQDKSSDLGLIPLPQKVEVLHGYYQFSDETTYSINSSAPEIDYVVAYFLDHFNQRYGINVRKTENNAAVRLIISDEFENPEGYHLETSPSGVSIAASDPSGLFYGVITLIQLLDEGEKKGLSSSVSSVNIVDSPRYIWRGMHLDVGRHFFPVQFIKRYIDLIAMHKMNKFHWHLTEDQGWRIEIKKYPKLTEIGGWRPETLVGHYTDDPRKFDGVRYGGFYTQQEIKEVVEYAKRRFITVVPEIEMPGHSVAALAAYPELSCTGGPFAVEKMWGVHEDVYCAGKEETFEFLIDVLTEVVELFPSTYVHIGGDECPKVRWEEHDLDQKRIEEEGLKDEHELQSYFIKRIERFLLSKNKRLIGWDEILEGGLAPEATVMSWRGVKGGIEAANSGHDVVMTPTSHCYFDYYQSENKEAEPIAIGGFLSLEKVYEFEPMPPDLDPQKAHHILGGQGNVWTEYISSEEYAEYMMLPRMCAMAEVLWTPEKTRSFEKFVHRLKTVHFKRLDRLGVNYRIPKENI
ncbi:MAG: beta-N-acetylhexosaminidase [Dehalococcoidia bacterium]|nr:beta-N-acetylhexosaminidase [Dehalococcoidia bacterium]